MGKRKKRSIIKEWPDTPSACIDPSELLFPLKKILCDGYDIKRQPISQFIYIGYNIGKQDRLNYPTPKERFSSRWIENEAKYKRTLLDNVLFTAFQLGIEQGRRLSYNQIYSSKFMENLLIARTKTIKCLREKLSKYDKSFEDDISVIPTENQDNGLIIDNIIGEAVDV